MVRGWLWDPSPSQDLPQEREGEREEVELSESSQFEGLTEQSVSGRPTVVVRCVPVDP